MKRFERNLGFMTRQEHQHLEDSTVSIAGVGGDGALIAVELARMGVGSMRLADPDPFEIENINRQAVCRESTIGTNKAVAVADYLREINPMIELEVFSDGINKDNAKEFVSGSTLVIDETEFTFHELGVMLARQARSENIPVMTALNIGFAAIVTTFRPDGRPLERMLGFKETDHIDDIAKEKVAISRWLPYLPSYADLSVLEKVASGEKSAPSVAPGVAMAAGIATTQAFLNIVGTGNNRPKPVYNPSVLVADAMTKRMKVTKFNRTSHYRHLLLAVGKNYLNINAKADY